jgi:hypothetical protein
MKNNKQQTAVEWLSNRAYELFEQYSEGKFDRITLNKLMLEATDKAKEMENGQIMKAHISAGARLEDISIEAAEQYYNETYGGGHQ